MATQAEIARHLDLSDRSVRELVDKGVLPQARRGEMDPDVCRVAYIRHLRSVAAGRGGVAEQEDLTAQRARLAAEQADHYAIRNKTARLELLPRTAVTAAVTAAFGRVRDRLLALPDRLAGPLARLTDDGAVRQRLADAINQVLGELAETEVIAVTERDAADAAP